MSFISKRERVFNEYDLLDLPARNEGKLKAYSSCTDARAWSHFCSDKSDHLVEIIKRNNDTCRPKYIPTDVIVNTLMVTKNTEINRLRRKIEEFEQLLAAYDQLELTSDQKCEIANAHASIKAANKQLDDMCLDLDLSGFTEGIDSETFETGKSRGDEIMRFQDFETSSSFATERSIDKTPYPNKETQTQSDPTGALSCPCDASTVVHDPRIEEMKDTIIRKDAKLNAMRNTIAVMENDVCEPYCIYAHIYTALEKIFGTLCQNEKYKQYLDLLTSGKDTRNVDIKGKIFYKLKVFEKFCCALISPCSKNCSCYHTEIISRVETAFAVSTQDNFEINIDSKRAHLVADIIGNDEMKEILSKNKTSAEEGETSANGTLFINNSCSIEVQNLSRLKNLQMCYDDLLVCYDELKYEKNCLTKKCQKYDELEKDFEILQNKLNSCNMLLTEKDYYKKRSEDLDDLKEKYIVLADETSNLETQLRAQNEINDSKSLMLEQLRNENISLQSKLSESSTAWEKEKHALICKLKENECTMMCQDQQIETLTVEINKFLRKNKDNAHKESQQNTAELIDQINTLKEEIKNLKDTLLYKEEENNQLRNEFHEKLIIDNLEIDNWKDVSEKMIQRSENLEALIEELQDCVKKLTNENKGLLSEKKDLINELANKCLELKSVTMEADSIKQENSNLLNQLQEMNQLFNDKIQELESEKKEALNSLSLASKESKLLLETISNFGKLSVNSEKTNNLLISVKNSDEKKIRTLENQGNGSDVLLNEIDKFVALNTKGIKNLLSQSCESIKYLEEKDSEALESKGREIDDLNEKLKVSQKLYEDLVEEKSSLLNKLQEEMNKLDKANNRIQILQEEKEHFITVIDENNKVKEELVMMKHQSDVMLNENNNLKNDLLLKNHEIQSQLNTLAKLKIEKKRFLSLSERVRTLEHNYIDLCKEYDNLLLERDNIQSQLLTQRAELSNLQSNIKVKGDENNKLVIQIQALQEKCQLLQNKTDSLQTENFNIKSSLDAIKEENNTLTHKINMKAAFENDLVELKAAHDKIKSEKENLELELQSKLILLQNSDIRNQELQETTKNLIAYNKNIEDSLINARKELQLQVKSSSNSLLVGDIKSEVKKVKEENYCHLKRIQHLLKELEDADQTIANLGKEITDRDDKITILENQVNELGDEVKRLQTSLATMIDLGENRDVINHEIDQSLKQVEAHHSKATHNMRIELAKLKDQNLQLEKQISTTKIEIETSFKQHETRLNGEREIIATDIKQLEIKCVGDSALSPDNCNLKSIMTSLERIDNYIETRNNSCHLVLTKADEAKKIVEKEKHKIFKEKEQAIKEKMDVQKELNILKKSLEHQLSKDKTVINDLEAELLNQKLLIDKLKQSVRIYILKLEEEIRSLQDMYTTALDRINQLEIQQEDVNKDRKENEIILNKVRLELEEKNQDIKSLRTMLDILKSKKLLDFAAQTELQNNFTNISTQTEKIDLNKIDGSYLYETNKTNQIIDGYEEGRVINKHPDDCIVQKSDEKQNQLLLNIQPPEVKEVQILTANIEPTLGFVKNAYVHYKIKKLSFTAMEQYSVSCISNEGTLDSVSRGSCKVNEVNSSLDANMSKLEMASKESSNQNTGVNSFSSKSKNENEKNYTGTTPTVALIRKISTDNIFANTSGSNEMNLSLTHSNIASNKDFIIIYRDSDCENDSKINTEVSKERLNKSKHRSLSREIIVPQNDNYSAKVITNTKPFNEKEYRHETIHTSLGYEHKNNLIASNPVYSHITLSETSFIKDLAIVTNVNKVEKNRINASNGIDSHISNSFTSLKSFKKNSESLELEKNHMDEVLTIMPKAKIDLYLYQQNIFDRNSNSYNENVFNEFVDTTSQSDIIKEEGAFKQNIEITANAVKKTEIEYKVEDNKGDLTNTEIFKQFLRRTYSNETLSKPRTFSNSSSISRHTDMLNSIPKETKLKSSKSDIKVVDKIKTKDVAVMVEIDNHQDKIKFLTSTLENIDRNYKEKIRAIKTQYDNNIKNIINEHNQGVQSLQGLHEETLQDILKVHENETDNLRTMSIEAMRKVDKLEKENKLLRAKIILSNPSNLNEDLTNTSSIEINKQNSKNNSHYEIKTLTKTDVEEFNYNPKAKIHGPCTCSLDINISDTIRNIFEQVDVEQRKMAEQAYLKYIANKILKSSIEALDAQELSFLHFKICRTWKSILRKEEVLSKRIDCLENEVINKQRQRNKHIAEIDRKVAEERRRLQEVREAVCRDAPFDVPVRSPQTTRSQDPSTVECNVTVKTCVVEQSNGQSYNVEARCGNKDASGKVTRRRTPVTTFIAGIDERLPAGDLVPGLSCAELRYRCANRETNRMVSGKGEERREKKLYYDEKPTRLRRSADRPNTRTHKK